MVALLDAAKAAEPTGSLLEATVAADLLQHGLLPALKVRLRVRVRVGVRVGVRVRVRVRVAADLLQHGLLPALKVAVRDEWAPERSGGRHSA